MPFHYVGVVNEFPTAPKDSFFVANAAYVAAAHRQRRRRRVPGRHRRPRHRRRRRRGSAHCSAPTATVTDIAQTRARVGSSLTAVDLAGLTRVELAFALLLAAAAGGLVLALGLAERRRSLRDRPHPRRDPPPAARPSWSARASPSASAARPRRARRLRPVRMLVRS